MRRCYLYLRLWSFIRLRRRFLRRAFECPTKGFLHWRSISWFTMRWTRGFQLTIFISSLPRNRQHWNSIFFALFHQILNEFALKNRWHKLTAIFAVRRCIVGNNYGETVACTFNCIHLQNYAHVFHVQAKMSGRFTLHARRRLVLFIRISVKWKLKALAGRRTRWNGGNGEFDCTNNKHKKQRQKKRSSVSFRASELQLDSYKTHSRQISRLVFFLSCCVFKPAK